MMRAIFVQKDGVSKCVEGQNMARGYNLDAALATGSVIRREFPMENGVLLFLDEKPIAGQTDEAKEKAKSGYW